MSRPVDAREEPEYLRSRLAELERQVSQSQQEIECLRASERQYREFYEQAPLPYQSLDEDARIVSVNSAWLDMLGYSRQDVIGRPFEDFLAGDSPERLRICFPRFLAERRVDEIEFDVRRSDGTICRFVLNGCVIDDVQGDSLRTHCILRDVTQQRTVEALLQKERDRLAWAERLASLGNWEWNARTDLVTWSENMFSLYEMEMTPGRVVPRGMFRSVLHPDDAALVYNTTQKAMAGTEPVEVEYRICTSAGNEKHIWAHQQPIVDANGVLTGLFGIDLDVTHAKQAEQVIRASEERFSRAFHHAPVLMTLNRMGGGEYVDVNDEFARVSGFSRQELIGKTAIDVGWMSQKDVECLRGELDRSGRVSGVQLSLRTKGGESVQFLYSGELIEIDGQLHFLSIALDITERVRIQDALRQSEERFRELYEYAPVAHVTIDLDGIILECNRAAGDLMHCEIDDLIGQSVLGLQAAGRNGVEQAARILERLRAGEMIRDELVLMQRADGSTLWVGLTITPIKDERGHLVFSRAVAIDITERVENARRVRLQAEMLSQIRDAITATDLDGRITYVNQVSRELMQRPMEELTGQSVETFGEDPEYGASQREIIERTRAEGQWRGEVVNIAGDGSRVIFDTRTHLLRDEDGEPFGMIGISTDITEHVKVVDALRESEERYRRLVENQGEGIVFVDMDENFVFANPAAHDIFGAPQGGLVGRNVAEFLDEAGFGLVLQQTEMRRQGVRSSYDLVITRPDGEKRHLLSTGNPRLDREGNLIGTFGVLSDITDRVRAERALRESKELLEKAFASMQDAMFVLETGSWEIVECNPAAIEIFGYSRQELIGQPMTILHEEESASDIMRQHLYAAVEQDGVLHDFEFPMRRKDGSLFPAEHTVSQLLDETGRRFGWLSLIRDITERKQTEEDRLDLERQLLHAQKLESLGVLAGGIAHDFNNLLMAMLGNTDLALLELSPVSPVRPYLEDVSTAARRAAGLAQQMLAYSGKGRFVIELLDLNDVIREMTHLLEVSISKRAILKYDLAGSLPRIEADATQVRQVIMNLITNASEALDDQSGCHFDTHRRRGV